MTELQKSNLVKGLSIGAVLGVLTGAAVMYSFQQPSVEDDDRPPIIVRGGSLIFESGDTKKSKPGKPWRKETVTDSAGQSEVQWKPDHEKARSVGLFVVSFENGTDASGATCVSEFLPELTVIYDHDGEAGTPAIRYLISRRPRNNGNGTMAPTVIQTAPLTEDNTSVPDYPTLTLTGTETKIAIEYTRANGQTVVCSADRATVEPRH
ncbi:MAG TPA: hypothetical protein VNJ03_16735 [Vicinamibacterales bacterium]|nr:hypothetical protein [Vicinamibacterales bacterium]